MNTSSPSRDAPTGTCTAFVNHRRVATGRYAEVAQALAGLDLAGDNVLVFDDDTTALLDVPAWPVPEAALHAARAAAPGVPEAPPAPAMPAPPPSVGRPKLGVVAREVTLLPRHWTWLGAQPSGASAALRRLVDEARRIHAGRDAQRAAQERGFRFMNAVAGNLPGFEPAVRQLYAGDGAAFRSHIAAWPDDVRVYAERLAAPAFAAAEPSAASAESSAAAAAPTPLTGAAVVHLIFGPQGAGKSTLARELAEQLGGVVYAIDTWMGELFGPDLPMPMDLGWILARVRRCEDRICREAAAVARRGVPPVLDLGGMTLAARQRLRDWMAGQGLAVQVHFVLADAAVRRQRVQARNAERGATFSFEVTPAMFDHMDARYQPPDAAELEQARVLRT